MSVNVRQYMEDHDCGILEASRAVKQLAKIAKLSELRLRAVKTGDNVLAELIGLLIYAEM